MEFVFRGVVWHWRGPSPYHFVWVPDDESERIRDVAAEVTYGWGMIPVQVTIGRTTFTTSLWPKEGRYVVPLKDVVRRAEHIELGDDVEVRLAVAV